MGQVQFQSWKILQDHGPVPGVCEMVIVVKAGNSSVFTMCGDWDAIFHTVFIDGIQPHGP